MYGPREKIVKTPELLPALPAAPSHSAAAVILKHEAGPQQRSPASCCLIPESGIRVGWYLLVV